MDDFFYCIRQMDTKDEGKEEGKTTTTTTQVEINPATGSGLRPVTRRRLGGTDIE